MIGYSLNLRNMLPWLTGQMQRNLRRRHYCHKTLPGLNWHKWLVKENKLVHCFTTQGFFPIPCNCSEIPKLLAEKQLQNIPTSILAPCILMCSWMSKYLQQIGKIGKMLKCYIYCRFLHWEPHWWFKWVQNQEDVLFLEKTQYNSNHYQFVLNDNAAQHFTPLTSQHKAKTTVLTKTLKASFGAYSSNFSHEIKLFSTYPYVAKDMSNSLESCLDFMHVISKLSLVFGNSHEFGK